MIDAHIHLERYAAEEQAGIMAGLEQDGIEALIAVSMDLASCKRTADLAAEYPRVVMPAYGLHPEQPIPSEQEMDRLLDWIRLRAGELVAVGEIGLPYYLRSEKEAAGEPFELEPYVKVLGRFLDLAAELDKPVILHAVYEDADIACDLLERHGVTRAHFHWFKGAEHTVRRMAERGYYISFTPDIVYEEEIRELAALYPPELVMAETDGPWPFEGPFAGRTTDPRMIADVAAAWGKLHGLSFADAAAKLTANTRRFYGI
ncbi:TatD family hydrolase [Paenibacillus caui]|uniref:TatD family hydrolase n=1 Tax=Paenibacillus caui TaxID=2873927 RepID=UPI001CA7DC38|nr:TatD family hydrolase [Paenibacillus caui]